AEPAGAAPGRVLPRQRRVRSRGRGLRLEPPGVGRTALHALRHHGTRQRQHGPRVRHDAVRRREGRDRGIPQDVLKTRSATMINDTPAGRWFKRVMWLGILANLALALPTIAAP